MTDAKLLSQRNKIIVLRKGSWEECGTLDQKLGPDLIGYSISSGINGHFEHKQKDRCHVAYAGTISSIGGGITNNSKHKRGHAFK